MGHFSRLSGIAFLLSLALPLCAQSAQTPAAEPPIPLPATIQPVPPPPPDASPDELEAKGDDLRAEKMYLDSIDYYRAAVAKKETAPLHNKIGISLLLLRRDREAKKEFERAIHLDKKYSEAYNNLGALYYNGRHFGSAIKQYKKAIKLNDDNASFHSNLGTAYFSEKDYDKATKEYQQAMAIDPQIFERVSSGGVAVKLITSNEIGHFHYVMAEMYSQHNDVQHCRYYLQKASEEGYPIKDALRDSVFARLRKDPAFVNFIHSLKRPSADGNE